MELRTRSDGFTQTLAKTILRIKSWKLDINLPSAPKFVLIGAPHTSGMDLFYALLLLHGGGIQPHWVGKDSLFKGPVGPLTRALGGIPVNRRSSNSFVQQIVNMFNQVEKYVLAIAPEGTRSRAEYWKTGFYHIAIGARVPIALGYLDYGNKIVGIGQTIYPTGDIQADFVQIREFYSGIKGRKPELQGEIKLRPE